MLATTSTEFPCVVQLFGSEPQIFARAIEEYINNLPLRPSISIWDVRFRKLQKQRRQRFNARRRPCLRNCACRKKRFAKPVSVKIRSGWDKDHINAPAFALAMQQAGADMIIVHPRTKEQVFTGKSDWHIIAQVKKVCSVPVIANGDIFSPQDATSVLTQTGADGIMIGRGAMGNPWLFGQIVADRAGLPYTSPTCEEIFHRSNCI